MDLGCIDMGCVEKDSSPKESTTSASNLGKNKVKDAIRSSSNALNKLTSQISKPPRRKTSPLNWFPRKKVEPYLKRKLKMLQEVDGMHLTLVETLGDSNPHYSRVLREKIAIREAAQKAMEARKAAMVEASWCRILKAARIESKEAEEQLSKAELSAAEAFEAAQVVGVIMNGTPDSGTGGSTTHKVSAIFESAFSVDNQVAAAVKAAFVKLANCHSINKDEFKELLHKISENPDLDDLSAITSEYDSNDAGSDAEAGSCKDSSKLRKRPESDKFNMTNIVEMMLGRLQCLKEEELASLATIVATSGLNAALAETEYSSAVQNTENPCPKVSRRSSVCGRATKSSRGAVEDEIPGLGQFLVKRLTRLEREILEAKNARKNEASDGSQGTDDEKLLSANDSSLRSKVKNIKDDGTAVPDLGSVLTKHKSKLEKEIEEAKNARKNEASDGSKGTDDEKLLSTNDSSSRSKANIKDDGAAVLDLGSVLTKHKSKLEKEIEEARRNGRSSRGAPRAKQDATDIPSLDKYLVKRLTRLEMEVQEARNRNRLKPTEKTSSHPSDAKSSEDIPIGTNEDSQGKENIDLNMIENRNTVKRKETQTGSESDHLVQKEERNTVRVQKLQRKSQENGANYESLDKVLVKHVSRLEKEKLEFCADESMQMKPKRKDSGREMESSLDQVLVKHKSKLEMAKMAAEQQQEENNSIRHSVTRREEARERELQATWGGMSLGNSMRPHVSRLQRDKAAWLEAEEEEKNIEVQSSSTLC
ncbi:uncharacterized protein LOC121756800 isoform X1 [Salvia splendens]|uniref:uncharacterized protein LOC121756800 isoform X1 n=2 Tax=Salvia splendens TaxID=180675 RepID=UPI001C265D82|nr:uncharacterized protein LOC121756800 isoform X1 [Salvia splendens]